VESDASVRKATMSEEIPQQHTDVEKALFFGREEFEGRWAAVRAEMVREGFDVLLVFNAENVLYLSGYQSIGYSSFLCLVVPRSGEMTLCVREMEMGCARYFSMVEDVVIYADHEEPVAVLERALASRGLTKGRIGVEFDAAFIGARRIMRLAEELRPAEVVDASGTVEKARAIKSPEELVYVRQACRATEEGMRAAIESVKEGVTENAVAAAMFSATVAAGSTFMSSDPIVTSGPKSGVAHTTFDGRRIQRGDLVLLELGGCVKRYSGALMRTVAVGNVPEEARKMASACRAGLEAAIDAIRPGATAGEVDKACVAQMAKAGYEALFRKRTGYSVGVSYPPDWGEGHIVSLRQGDPTPLEPGMVFHIPPALRSYARWGVGVSETVLVTPDGCEVLTHLSRELFQR